MTMRTSFSITWRLAYSCFVALLSVSLLDTHTHTHTASALTVIPAPVSSSVRLCLQQRQRVCRLGPTPPTTKQTTTRSSSRSRSRSLSVHMHMGMGHSHSHSESHSPSEVQAVIVDPKTAVLSHSHNRRRRIALFLFCGLAILGPSLLKRRSLQSSDLIAFLLTGSTLALVETTIRRQVIIAVNRIQNLTYGIRKHSTPLTVRYFFKNDNAADRVTLLGGVINIVLSTAKFAVGVTCHSSALIADAGHSLSDLFSDVITLWAVQIGRLPPDDDHPYGHGKFEAIGSLFLALTLLGTGISVGAVSNKNLIEIISIQRSAGIHGLTALAGQIPTFPALVMAAVSIFSKEWLYRITRNVGEKLNSQVVIANAWHHRSDAYSSVLALISIGMAMYIPGFLAADAAAGILVAGMICMTGAEILGESIKQLTDTSNPGLVEKVTAIVTQQQDVSSVNRVRARQVGSSSIIDVSVSLPEDLASSAARAIEEELKAKILQQDGVVDVVVRATSPGVVCPLLEATNVRPTASEVERRVREEILLKHPQVTSVEGVTVHYQDTLLVNVDVDIRVDGQISIVKAKNMANDIRNSLESGDQIHKANIFLDLNEGVAARPGVNVRP